MIRPPGLRGVAFTESSAGDVRGDGNARRAVSRLEGIPERWATVNQVHGANVVRVDGPGSAGEADALWTTEPGLTLAVFTADCFGVVLKSESAVGVAHAGWRGATADVVGRLRSEMTSAGQGPDIAAVGPGIRPCCFEVGPDVLEKFPGHGSTTSWDTDSVDLPAVIGEQLDDLDVWFSDGCTHHDDGFFSHRRSATPERMAALGWL